MILTDYPVLQDLCRFVEFTGLWLAALGRMG
jgi:hypothetical protein